MSKRRESGTGIWVWAGMLLFALVLFLLPASIKNGLSSLVRNGLYSPFVWADAQIKLMRDNFSRYIITKQELAKAKAELEELREIRAENERLRNLLNFKNRSEYSLLLAEVIGSGEYRYPSSLIINAGKNQGVHPEMPVLTAEGVIGKVRNVAATTSVVQILGDPGFHISARDRVTGIVGIVESEDGKTLLFNQVPIGESVAEGDRIVTSGLGKVFPKGLLIGYVVSVIDPPEGMFKKIVVQPAANLKKLEEVFILMEFGPSSAENDSIEGQ
ncbi:rod shape-determining protein MreC [bacterium]|nr:rod shape-determining protein MreC [bacterium]